MLKFGGGSRLAATSYCTAVSWLPTIAADFTKWPGVFLTSRVMRSCESVMRLCSLYSRRNKELCTLNISLIYSNDTDIINDVKRDMV